MTQIALIRCEKNVDRCPWTTCFKCVAEKKRGFSGYTETSLAGVFTCRCPGDNIVNMAQTLKSRDAEAIHFCTCMFACTADSEEALDDGDPCDNLDTIIEKVHQATGLPCIKGTTPKEDTP